MKDEKVVRRQCQARLFYGTTQSSRVMSDGEKRYLKGDHCLKKEAYTDKSGDGWCQIHAVNPNVIANFGPMKRIKL